MELESRRAEEQDKGRHGSVRYRSCEVNDLSVRLLQNVHAANKSVQPVGSVGEGGSTVTTIAIGHRWVRK